jgi:PPM family protein phosphatase
MTELDASISIAACGQSDVGLVRENNEDSFLIADLNSGVSAPDSAALRQIVGGKGCLFLVADGMGGLEAGEVASRMAVELTAQYFLTRLRDNECSEPQVFVSTLKKSIEEANQRVFEEARKNSKLRGMGTTLTAAAVYGGSIFFAQVGDSRAYLERNGFLTQMTQDQSVVAQLVSSGALMPEDAKAHPQRNVILQAVGAQDHVDVAISSADLRRGDRVVLCSDGLWGKLEEEELKEILDRFDPKGTCQRLVELARERGGEDNITIIVAHFDGDGLPPTTPDERPVYASLKEEAPRRLWPWGKS